MSNLVDCQSHLYVPEIVHMMEQRRTDPLVYAKGSDRFVRMGDWHRRILPKHMDVDAKLADMDANGIALTALTINDPGPEWFDQQGPVIARMANDFIADIVKQHPTRFFGLCVLPLQDMPTALEELDRCVQRLGMKGVLLYTNLAGRFPDDPQFRPLFARAVDLDVPILLHPALPVTASLLKDYEMISGPGNMFDDTIALLRIILSGIFDQYPQLKLVCPHLGGTLPFIIGRVDHQIRVLKRGPQNLKKAPSDYLRQVYFDIISPLPEAMRMVYQMVGPDRLLFGSDHPWVDPKLIIDCLKSLGLSRTDEDKILFQNARSLFRV
jgi:predicted TIM-barrel fold metal-dependent hydrolase